MSRFKIVSSMCITHGDEKVTAFCTKHCKPLCMKCILQQHSKCVADQEVEDVRATIEDSERTLPNMISSTDHMTVILNDRKEKIAERIDTLEKSKEAMNVGLETLKTSLIEQIKELSTDSLEMVKSVVYDQRRLIERDGDIIDGFMEDLAKIKEFVDDLNDGKSVSIGVVKSAMEKFTVLETKVNATDQSDKKVKLSFKVSEEVEFVRTHLLSLGELCVKDSKEQRSPDFQSESESRNHSQQDEHDVSEDMTDDSTFMLPVESFNNSLLLHSHEYVGIDTSGYDYLPPPPLPRSQPPSFISDKHSEGRNSPRVQSLPKQLSFEQKSDSRRPATVDLTLDGIERPKLTMPPLPKRRHSNLKHQRSVSSEVHDENIDGPAQQDHSMGSEPHSSESFVKISEQFENVDNLSQISTASLDDSVFSHGSRATSSDQMNKSDNSNSPTVMWQAESMSSINSQIQDSVDFTKLKPPRSHTFMWSASSSYQSKSVRDSGIHVSNTDLRQIPNQTPENSSSAFSDSDNVVDTEVENILMHTKRISHVDYIKDQEEPMKSLSHSDIPNLTDFHCQKKMYRTSSDKSLNWDRFGAEKDEVEYKKDLASSQDEGSSDQLHEGDNAANPTNTSISSDTLIKKNKKHSTSMLHVGLEFSPGSISTLNSIKPFVVKERKSDHCKNFRLPDLKDTSGHHGRSHHCTVTGIAITPAGHLFVCDFENHSIQHFNSSGVLVSDCTFLEPFSCCTVSDERVAVTSKSRKTLSTFELSETTMTVLNEKKVGLVTDVFGVGYADGFFAVCCRDQVTLLTKDLQPYCEIKPLMMTSRTRSKPYFSDARYVAIETRNKILLYVSEHNVNRVTCMSVDKTFKYRKEWESRVAKPRSLVISDECLLVAGKGKVVVLSSISGEHVRDIQTDVPSHPVHMVLHNHCLYMSKSSTSSNESRIIRKIRLN